MTDEAQVRQLLKDTDPIDAGQYVQAADDVEGRRTLARILAEPPQRRRAYRRRWVVVTGGAVALLSVVGAASAAGLTPASVVHGLLRGEEPDTTWGKLDTAKAQLVIEAQGPGGSRAQWWFAPGEKGGGCTYLRSVTAHGKSDGSTMCSGPPGVLPARNETLMIDYAPLTDGWMGVYGRAASPASQIRVRFKDGGQELVPVRPDGYFMQVFSRPDSPRPQPVEVAALDAKARVLASERVEPSAS